MTTATETEELFERAARAATAGDWPVAVAAYRAGLADQPDAAPRHYDRYGDALERTGELEAAAGAFSQAIARRRNVPAWWYFKLGRVQDRRKQWQPAAEAYRTAIEIRSEIPPGWHFRLGTMYERLGRWADVQRCYAAGLDADPTTTPMLRQMLESESQEFPGRRKILAFVAEHLDEIRNAATEPLPAIDAAPSVSDPIYLYWAQGFATAPEVVRLCHRRMLDHAGDRVLELDDAGMNALVAVPDDIADRDIAPTHRSDLLRLQLLSRYGGSWLDATCLVLADPGPELDRLRRASGWFAFGKRRTTLATWLMTSTPGHELPRMLYEALLCYWRHHERLSHYFALHYIFEALTRLDERFGALWAQTPRLPFNGPFAFRWQLAEPFDQDRFDTLLADSFVHKLTYKYEPEQALPETMLGQLLRTL